MQKDIPKIYIVETLYAYFELDRQRSRRQTRVCQCCERYAGHRRRRLRLQVLHVTTQYRPPRTYRGSNCVRIVRLSTARL